MPFLRAVRIECHCSAVRPSVRRFPYCRSPVGRSVGPPVGPIGDTCLALMKWRRLIGLQSSEILTTAVGDQLPWSHDGRRVSSMRGGGEAARQRG